MENPSEYLIKLSVGSDFSCKISLRRSYIPFTSKRIVDALPIRGRAIKRSGKLMLTTSIIGKGENLKNEFQPFDISIHNSTGTITLFLEKTKLSHQETYVSSVPQSDHDRLVSTIENEGLVIDMVLEW